jgi:hypothetical protein
MVFEACNNRYFKLSYNCVYTYTSVNYLPLLNVISTFNNHL